MSEHLPPENLIIEFLVRRPRPPHATWAAVPVHVNLDSEVHGDLLHLTRVQVESEGVIVNEAIQVYRRIEDNQQAGGYTILVDNDGNQQAVFFQ